MEIWIIRNGEKAGPIHDYEIRRRIEARELTRDTMAWHDGLDSWRPLGEIALFKDDFNWVHLDNLDSTPLPGQPQDLFDSRPPVPAPPKLMLGRRFWARWLDLHVYIAVWWLGMWASGRNIEAVMNNIWVMVGQLVPWFIVESVLIHRFGTTPGKWLLGLRVTNTDGTALSLPAATLRSVRILIGGIGFGWPLLALFCQAFSFFAAKRLGKPLWDHAGGHHVLAKPLAAWRIATMLVIFFAALQLQMAVISPYVIKSAVEVFPFLKQELENNPPWHLPDRSTD